MRINSLGRFHQQVWIIFVIFTILFNTPFPSFFLLLDTFFLLFFSSFILLFFFFTFILFFVFVLVLYFFLFFFFQNLSSLHSTFFISHFFLYSPSLLLFYLPSFSKLFFLSFFPFSFYPSQPQVLYMITHFLGKLRNGFYGWK